MPTVFLALSTYNGGPYLRPLIDSIRRQSFADWTLVVRDDGSTDSTVAQLQAAAAEDSRIVLLEGQQRLGPSASFGHLMQHAYQAGAEHLFFVDQDDVWHDDKIERMLERLQLGSPASGGSVSHNSATGKSTASKSTPRLVYSDLTVVDAQLQVIHPSFLKYSGLRSGEGRPLRTLLGRNFVPGCACAVNRALLEFALPLPDTVAMYDWWLALCAAAVGEIVCLPQSTILYRRHAATATSAAGFWSRWNPLGRSWSKRWTVGWENFRRSLDQARSLCDRLRTRLPAEVSEEVSEGYEKVVSKGVSQEDVREEGAERARDALSVLSPFCELFDRPMGGWRRVWRLHRMGVPAIDLRRRLVYDLCVLKLR